MNIEHVREVVFTLQRAAGALAVLGAALDARATGTSLDPAIQPHVEEVLAMLGVEELGELRPTELRPLLGEIRAYALTNAKLLFAASRRPGWQHTEPELLEAAGDVSAVFPRALETAIAPKLDGLTERLSQPGTTFLDVGVGVGVLSIEMARLWPSLRVVGIDPFEPALAMARQRVQEAGLNSRIELRRQSAETLSDREAFDVAWIPSVFVPEGAVRDVVQRVFRALRPGGWLFFPMTRSSSDALASALARLRTRMFGGLVMPLENVEVILREHGFEDVELLPSSPTAVVAMFVGRRPS